MNPFWTKENNVETSSFINVNESFRGDNVILGATQSNCKLPCTTHSYTTKKIMKIVMKDQGLNWIDLMPSDKIDVVYTRTVNKTFTEYLADLVRNNCKTQVQDQFIVPINGLRTNQIKDKIPVLGLDIVNARSSS